MKPSQPAFLPTGDIRASFELGALAPNSRLKPWLRCVLFLDLCNLLECTAMEHSMPTQVCVSYPLSSVFCFSRGNVRRASFSVETEMGSWHCGAWVRVDLAVLNVFRGLGGVSRGFAARTVRSGSEFWDISCLPFSLGFCR
jgi:hypothetical protein